MDIFIDVIGPDLSIKTYTKIDLVRTAMKKGLEISMRLMIMDSKVFD